MVQFKIALCHTQSMKFLEKFFPSKSLKKKLRYCHGTQYTCLLFREGTFFAT